jgi:hypothetical protein
MLGDGHGGRLPPEDADVPQRGSGAFRGYSRRFVPEDKYEPPGESSAAQRRGQPIPFEELPPWLRNAGPQHGGAGAYAHAQVDEPEEEEWWPDDEQAGAQWNDWGDGEYAGGHGGNDGYDGYDGYEEQGEDEYADERKRGGWRRFFGRR